MQPCVLVSRSPRACKSFLEIICPPSPVTAFDQGPGGSELMRDFTYIDDVVAGVIGSLDSAPPSTPEDASFRTFNLGNTNPTSVSEFVGILEKHIGITANRHYMPVPPTGDVLATHADISKAKQEFGYHPRTDLDEGLRKFVQWYKEFYVRDKHEY